MPITASLKLEVWLTTPKFPAADHQGCNTLDDYERTAKIRVLCLFAAPSWPCKFCSPDITEVTPDHFRPWD